MDEGWTQALRERLDDTLGEYLDSYRVDKFIAWRLNNLRVEVDHDGPRGVRWQVWIRGYNDLGDKVFEQPAGQYLNLRGTTNLIRLAWGDLRRLDIASRHNHRRW